jgi:hypothetical protein
MKLLNVYNSNYNYSATLIINSNKYVAINPKENIQVEVDAWFGDKNFRLEEKQGQNWKESYVGRYNQNLILKLEH